MRPTFSVFATSPTLAADEPKNAMPAPGNVIFDVDATPRMRSSFPASRAKSKTFASTSGVSVKSCTAYALSHTMRKSGAAFMVARRRTVSSE